MVSSFPFFRDFLRDSNFENDRYDRIGLAADPAPIKKAIELSVENDEELREWRREIMEQGSTERS